jgi:hypothetical protein
MNAARAIQRQLFLEQNRVEVLAIYRDLMKKTSRALPRRFEREAKLAEFRYMFRESSTETDPDQINEIKMVFYTILQRLDQGVYPPFPKEQVV